MRSCEQVQGCELGDEVEWAMVGGGGEADEESAGLAGMAESKESLRKEVVSPSIFNYT